MRQNFRSILRGGQANASNIAPPPHPGLEFPAEFKGREGGAAKLLKLESSVEIVASTTSHWELAVGCYLKPNPIRAVLKLPKTRPNYVRAGLTNSGPIRCSLKYLAAIRWKSFWTLILRSSGHHHLNTMSMWPKFGRNILSTPGKIIELDQLPPLAVPSRHRWHRSWGSTILDTYSVCIDWEIIRLYGRDCGYTVAIVYGIGSINYEAVCILPALSYNKSTTVLICLTVSNAASYVFYHISKHFHKTYIRSLFVEDNETSSTVIQHTIENSIQDHLTQSAISRSPWQGEYLNSICATGRPTREATCATSTRLNGSTIRSKFCSRRLSYNAVK